MIREECAEAKLTLLGESKRTERTGNTWIVSEIHFALHWIYSLPPQSIQPLMIGERERKRDEGEACSCHDPVDALVSSVAGAVNGSLSIQSIDQLITVHQYCRWETNERVEPFPKSIISTLFSSSSVQYGRYECQYRSMLCQLDDDDNNEDIHDMDSNIRATLIALQSSTSFRGRVSGSSSISFTLSLSLSRMRSRQSVVCARRAEITNGPTEEQATIR